MEKTSSEKKEKPRQCPPMPWKTRLVLSLASFITDANRRPDGTVNRRLVTALDVRSHANPTPSHGVSSHDVPIDPSRDLWFRLFLPESPSPTKKLPVVVFFHGGGFAFLSPASRNYHASCRRFARSLPAVVLSINYRLSPEHRYPAPYDDGLDVLRFLDAGENPLNDPALVALFRVADLRSCFLSGDSAGGNIAHHVACRWTSDPDHRNRRLRVAGLFAIQPFFGGEERTEAEIRLSAAPLVNTERTDWLWKAFLPEGADRNHEAASVLGGGVAEGFPPVMVVIGGYDPLQDWHRRYVEGLKGRGREVEAVEYPGAIHAFYLFPEMPEPGMMVAEMKSFVERHSADAGKAENGQ